ncbi:MAG: recombinase family protein, partial [Dechloromonas agitata]|nr:recombinase family protein [Dechloromonas agitata]
MESPKVYSYLRFSDPKQATGGSISRQTEYARKWASDHGLILDESLSMRDEGLSAFHEKHVKQGAFGIFLEAVKAGRVPVGSVLIVEGLDRLSRAKPMEAQTQLQSIIAAGVEVVTASDGKRYSSKSLTENPMDIIYAVLVMIRAHEESATKSKRVSAAVRRKCEAWIAGTFRGRIVAGRDPGWISWDGTKFVIDPEKGEAMHLVVRLFLDGYGFQRIAKELQKHNLTLTGTNATNWIYQLIQRPDLIGVRVLKTGGDEYQLKDYYPRLLDDETYARLQLEYQRRKTAPRAAGGKSDIPGFFTGLSVGTCGECGTKLISQNQTRRVRADGTPAIYRRLHCPKCSPGSAAKGSFSAGPIEKAILDFCSDQMNLDALFKENGRSAAAQSKYNIAAARVVSLEKQQQKIVDAAFANDGDLPAVLVQKLRTIEAELKQAQVDVDLAKAGLLTATDTPDSATAGRWSELREAALKLNYDARLKTRQLISDTFSEIKVYFAGALAT